MDTQPESTARAWQPRKVVGGALGVAVFAFVFQYLLGFRRAPSSQPTIALATVLFSVSGVLWITQNLSSTAARKLDQLLLRLLPWTSTLCLALAGIAAAVILVAVGVAPFFFLFRMGWPKFGGAPSLFTGGIFWFFFVYVVVGLFLGAVGGVVLAAWLKVLETHLPSTGRAGLPSWWKLWPAASVIFLIVGQREISGYIVLLAILGGSLFVYAALRVTRWVFTSPVELGSLASEVAGGSSVSLGVVWVFTLLSTALVLLELFGEY